MKIVKELPKSLFYSIILHFSVPNRLLSSKKPTLPVIVSLTSIPSRLKIIHLVIKSIFNQSHLPLKIILWLNEDLKNIIPKTLNNFPSSIFEIRFSKLDCPHLKLVESLKAFPNEIIVTCDDDLIYAKNWLENLYSEHIKYPKAIIAHGTYQIQFDEKGNYLPYKKWKTSKKLTNPKTIFPLGVWGVIYPPNSFSKMVLNEDLFLKLTPKADDLWFKAMSLLNSTESKQSENPPKQAIPIIGSQKIALKKDNVSKNRNDDQWTAVSRYFNLKKLISQD